LYHRKIFSSTVLWRLERHIPISSEPIPLEKGLEKSGEINITMCFQQSLTGKDELRKELVILKAE
jgi:hypothetical protein